MPRRRVLTEAQLDALLALPMDDAVLVRHWMLGADDLAAIGRAARRDRNQLGFAIQLCALRYPGRLPRPGELIPELCSGFIASLTRHWAELAFDLRRASPTTWREQLDALRIPGFPDVRPEHRREFLTWLLPLALGNTNGFTVGAALMAQTQHSCHRMQSSGQAI